MSELETVMAKLPSEMWVAIARAGPGEMAFAMERVCQSWHSALVSAGDALWKPLTLARFPRIAGILRASLTDPPPYREMYREQAEARRRESERRRMRPLIYRPLNRSLQVSVFRRRRTQDD